MNTPPTEQEQDEWARRYKALLDIIRELVAELETVEYDSDPPNRVLAMMARARAALTSDETTSGRCKSLRCSESSYGH